MTTTNDLLDRMAELMRAIGKELWDKFECNPLSKPLTAAIQKALIEHERDRLRSAPDRAQAPMIGKVVGVVNLSDMAAFFRDSTWLRAKSADEVRSFAAEQLDKLAACGIDHIDAGRAVAPVAWRLTSDHGSLPWHVSEDVIPAPEEIHPNWRIEYAYAAPRAAEVGDSLDFESWYANTGWSKEPVAKEHAHAAWLACASVILRTAKKYQADEESTRPPSPALPTPTAPAQAVDLLPPIESNEFYKDRFYIPLPGGWEIQTKGSGSSFRICNTKTGERMNITHQPYVYEIIEQMAREIHAEWNRRTPPRERAGRGNGGEAVSLYEQAIAAVERNYPESVFPESSDSIDARSASMARLTCRNIRYEYEQLKHAADEEAAERARVAGDDK